MEHGADDHMMKESHTEMTIKRDCKVEESEPPTAYVDIEIDINYLKQEPGLVHLVKSEPAFLAKEEILEDSRQREIKKYTDELQSVPSTSTLAIVGGTSVPADSVEKGELLHIKKQLADTDLDIGPTVFQYVDSHYRTKQMDLNGIQQANKSLNVNPIVVLSRNDDHQVKDETIESRGKDLSSVYACDYCSKKFSWKEALASHLQKMHKSKWYRCNVCKRNFICQLHLSRHTQHMHGTEEQKHQSYKCDECLKVYKSRDSLWHHITRVHATESHKCIQCNKEFKCKIYLVRHIRNTHDEEQYECDICKKTCKSRAALHCHVSSFHRYRSAGAAHQVLYRDEINPSSLSFSNTQLSKSENDSDGLNPVSSFHLKRVQQTDKNDSPSHQVPGSEEHRHQHYSCDKCLKVFKSKYNRNKHIKHIHGIESHKCVQCNKDFKCKLYLQNHVKHAHVGKHFECAICKKIYKSGAALRNHVSSVHRNRLTDPNDSKYRCGKCMKLFQFKGQLKRHCNDIHGAERHKCAECNKEYKCVRYLRIHIKNVHGSHVHDYTCDHCQKTFWRKQGLRYHMESVHGKHIHRCRKCNKTFKCRIGLQLHQKSIHGKPTHECEVCHKLFTTTYRLRAHVKKTHGLDDVQSKSDLPSQEAYDPCPIAGNTSAVVDTGTQQHNASAVESELAHVELELSPIVFQHMESNCQPHNEEL